MADKRERAPLQIRLFALKLFTVIVTYVNANKSPALIIKKTTGQISQPTLTTTFCPNYEATCILKKQKKKITL